MGLVEKVSTNGKVVIVTGEGNKINFTECEDSSTSPSTLVGHTNCSSRGKERDPVVTRLLVPVTPGPLPEPNSIVST